MPTVDSLMPAVDSLDANRGQPDANRGQALKRRQNEEKSFFCANPFLKPFETSPSARPDANSCHA